MNPPLARPLLVTAVLLGVTAGYFEISHAIAQRTGAANSGPATAEPASTPSTTAASALPSGNPLWTLPLNQLSISRERPIFSPSRRPPPVITPVYVAPVAPQPPPSPKEPERPAISLVGTVASTSEAIGVFLETATRNVVRLRTGDDHQGWVLRSVKGRDATLEKGSVTAVLELPPPGSGNPAIAANSASPTDPPAQKPPRP